MSSCYDQYVVLLIIVIAIMLFFVFISRPCDYNRNENFDIGNNYCTDFSTDLNSCLGYAGNNCNYCASDQICFPKNSTYNNICSDVLTSLDYYPYYYPYIYDIYTSTAQNFDWNDWYIHHNYFPPFIYKQGSYYFNPDTLPPNDPSKNKYPLLVHNGAASSGGSNLASRRGQFSQSEITASINNIKNLDDVGNKIIGSLNQQNSQSILENLARAFNLPPPRPRPPVPSPTPLPIPPSPTLLMAAESTPTGVSSSSSVTSMPANIGGIPTRNINISRGLNNFNR